jgi:cytidine deaminase
MDVRTLIEEASKALSEAYAPYSSFKVGASVLTEGGKVFRGCNVENASFGLTICAERVAIFAAVAAGHRKIKRVVIVGEGPQQPVPCGACLQVMSEFGVEQITAGISGQDFKTYELKELLPRPFRL